MLIPAAYLTDFCSMLLCVSPPCAAYTSMAAEPLVHDFYGATHWQPTPSHPGLAIQSKAAHLVSLRNELRQLQELTLKMESLGLPSTSCEIFSSHTDCVRVDICADTWTPLPSAHFSTTADLLASAKAELANLNHQASISQQAEDRYNHYPQHHQMPTPHLLASARKELASLNNQPQRQSTSSSMSVELAGEILQLMG